MGLGNFYTSAVSGLHLSQRAISVTANNIANVNTKGYSKQIITVDPRDPQMLGGNEFGIGVDVGEINRSYDTFIESRLLTAAKNKSQWSALSYQMSQVENIFNELDGEGLSSYMNQFFDSFSAVASDASSLAARQGALGRAQVLVDRFHSLDTELSNLRKSLNLKVESAVNEINSVLVEVGNLSEKIKNFPAEALTYRDERQMKVRELSELLGVEILETSDGDFQMYAANFPLIVGGFSGEFSVSADAGNDGLYKVEYSIEGSNVDLTAEIDSGELGMILQTRDTTLVDYISQLDELAFELGTEFNAVHNTGFDLNSNNNNMFFTELAQISGAARLLDLHADVDGIPSGIAASGAANDVPGGNTVALSLAQLRDSDIVFTSQTSTFSDFYSSLLADIGITTGYAAQQGDFYENSFMHVEVERERISGVSIEEEELNLMKYRAAYDAAARLISVGTDMLDTLVKLGA